MRLLYIALFACLASACQAQTAQNTDVKDEFDCTVISSSAQLDECVRRELKVSNTLLSQEFDKLDIRVKNAYKADPKLGKELIKKAHDAQEAWIAFRDLSCIMESFEVEEGSPAHVTAVNDCSIRMNGLRIEDLKKLL